MSGPGAGGVAEAWQGRGGGKGRGRDCDFANSAPPSSFPRDSDVSVLGLGAGKVVQQVHATLTRIQCRSVRSTAGSQAVLHGEHTLCECSVVMRIGLDDFKGIILCP